MRTTGTIYSIYEVSDNAFHRVLAKFVLWVRSGLQVRSVLQVGCGLWVGSVLWVRSMSYVGSVVCGSWVGQVSDMVQYVGCRSFTLVIP